MSVEKLVSAICDRLKGKSLLAVFDRDGTLVPINPVPEEAILEEDTRKILLKLNNLPKANVAILSARSLKELGQDFTEDTLLLAGNYGLELKQPGKERRVNAQAKSFRKELVAADKLLRSKLPQESAVILEDHELVLCLHWHLTPAQYRSLVHNTVKEAQEIFTNLKIKSLPTSYEIWPPIDWDKSHGLQEIASLLRHKTKYSLLLYFGDSEADEPAFAHTNKLKGISIKVGPSPQTCAQYVLQSASEVSQVAEMLLQQIK